MLRLFVVLLLLANGVYYAWAEGLLLQWGFGPLPQREPHRIAQQIRPEDIRVLPPDEARRIESAGGAGRPAECLQMGPFDEAMAEPLRQTLAPWPSASWRLEPVAEPGRWIVYMGKYPDTQSVERKKGQLRQIGVAFEALTNADLEPGLSLGGHPTQQAAEQQLDQLVTRGVRTARVVQERPEQQGLRLTFPAVDETLRPRVEELRAALNGRPLRPCR
ncbi:SPOR domain-containing protein [Ramlibacter henchirensis]|uniref:SPOR domain-containing protein n=1 Tax=Ramlibacter henchirensis TaxID=204072 RepID=A0A4Z0C501_9BURK|nr:SPOR domain-containing protein [Ramlibacter henchirensis]TFZ06817.1 SPOR domain-containing protein [Ramlibacter henchirensis]